MIALAVLVVIAGVVLVHQWWTRATVSGEEQ
jgi:hypothetical protein